MQRPLTEAKVERAIRALYVVDPVERLFCPLCTVNTHYNN